jgi:hypothetical protein
MSCHVVQMTGPGGPHEGRDTTSITFFKSFHGRTDGPAAFSDSSRNSCR